jgi:hypothetical protein
VSTPALTTVVRGVIGAAGDDHAQAVIERYEVGEGSEVGHASSPVIGPARHRGGRVGVGGAIATFGRFPSPSAPTTSAGTSAPVALPARTTVERKVSAVNVLALRDADDVARRVEHDAICTEDRLAGGRPQRALCAAWQQRRMPRSDSR